MRTTGPFSQYNRAIVHRQPKSPEDVMLDQQHDLSLDKSLLGIFGAGEGKFLVSFVDWAQADGTTYT